MDESRARLDPAAMALLLALCALWGLGQVAVKVGNSGVSPLLGAGIRSSGAALLLLAWSALHGERLLVRDGRLGYGVAVAALFAGEITCIYTGLVFTIVSRAVLFLYMAPFVVTLGAHFFLAGERLTPTRLAGLLCAFAGLTIAFADGLRLPTARGLVGDLIELGAAFCWGATTLTVKARGRGVPPSRTLFYQLTGSAVVVLPLSAAVGEAGVTRPSPAVLAAVVYQIVVVAFASYLIWFHMLTRYPASDLSAFVFWTPLFGVVAGGLILGETIRPAIGAAAVLVAAGIYLVNRPQRSAAAI